MPSDDAAQGRAPQSPLSADDHNGSKDALRYVYPVLSRRARGLSIGINLNPSKECNWACVYCEVDGLVRGAPDPVDLPQLGDELDRTLQSAVAGKIPIPKEYQEVAGERSMSPGTWIRDISLAGDGEPTLSPSFDQAISLAIGLRARYELESTCRLVVITNGSRVQRPEVSRALARLGQAGGEIWFKVDAGDAKVRSALNGVTGGEQRVAGALATISQVVPTWVQTMAVHPHVDADGVARVVNDALAQGAKLRGIHLYGIRRPSHQPGAELLRPLGVEELEAVAMGLRAETLLQVDVAH